jgi:drug/metabolite transporter (DMT)-like permease
VWRVGGTARVYVPPMKILGIILIVAGVLVLAFGGFSYTREKKVVDLGPIQATTKTEHNVPIPPIAGGAAILAGVAVLVAGTRKV